MPSPARPLLRPGEISRRDCLRLGLAGAGAVALPFARDALAFSSLKPALAGKFYVGMDRQGSGIRTSAALWVLEVESGDWTKVLDRCESHPRVSPDGRKVAFARDGALWVSELGKGAKPVRILEYAEKESVAAACWSADGKQLVVSPFHRDEEQKLTMFRTVRVNADGSGKESLPVPEMDGVWDWSTDGKWLLTTSHRNAKLGWQIYVMKPDGTGGRQITEGGNPFWPRLSADGKQVVFIDGTTEERRAIWVVDHDGKHKHKHKVAAMGTFDASACWSPDGKRVAIVYRDFKGRENGLDLSRIEVMGVDGENRSIFSPPKDHFLDNAPDWR